MDWNPFGPRFLLLDLIFTIFVEMVVREGRIERRKRVFFRRALWRFCQSGPGIRLDSTGGSPPANKAKKRSAVQDGAGGRGF